MSPSSKPAANLLKPGSCSSGDDTERVLGTAGFALLEIPFCPRYHIGCTFSDWRKGLAEQARVTRLGGSGCVVTWREPPGGGPFMVLFDALREVFPDRPAPSWPEGFLTLADPARLANEMTHAGFSHVDVQLIEAVWEGPAGQAYLDEMREMHQHMRPYVALDDDSRIKVDKALRETTSKRAINGRVQLKSPVLIAIGEKG